MLYDLLLGAWSTVLVVAVAVALRVARRRSRERVAAGPALEALPVVPPDDLLVPEPPHEEANALPLGGVGPSERNG
jgi:hypothetical protein